MHNEDTVELRIHTNSLPIPKNGNWSNLGNPVQAFPPKHKVSCPIIPQPLGVIFVETSGDVKVGSTYSSSFNSEIFATLRWSK